MGGEGSRSIPAPRGLPGALPMGWQCWPGQLCGCCRLSDLGVYPLEKQGAAGKSCVPSRGATLQLGEVSAHIPGSWGSCRVEFCPDPHPHRSGGISLSTHPSPPWQCCPVSHRKKGSGGIIVQSYPTKGTSDPKMGFFFSPLCSSEWLQVSTEQSQDHMQLSQSTHPHAEYSGTGISL